MTTRNKLLAKKFFKYDLWLYALTLAIICLVAFLLSKWVEAFCFCLSHFALRPKFNKQYHSINTKTCMLITQSVIFLGIVFTLPTSISLLSSIPIALAICWVGFIAQDRKDNRIANSQLSAKLTKLQAVDIYSMSDSVLRNYGASKGLSDLQQDILILRIKKNYRIVDICNERNYGRTTIKYHVAQIKKKLDLDKF